MSFWMSLTFTVTLTLIVESHVSPYNINEFAVDA